MGTAVTAWLTAVLLGIGGLFMLLAAVGVLRLPDLFTRMQASTKSSTLGAACMLLAVMVHFGTLAVITQAVLVIVFFFLTTPVSAHMIARAAYFSGVPLWKETVMNDLQGRYDPQTHTLTSPPTPSHGTSEDATPGAQATEP
jgi:multicomponent Na+:H+ antiporter subunit G